MIGLWLWLGACTVAPESTEPAPAAPATAPPEAAPEAVPDLVAPLTEAPEDAGIVTGLNAISPKADKCRSVIADKIPDVAHRVVLSFAINDKGKATNLTVVEDATKGQHWGKCIAGHVGRTTFTGPARTTSRATWSVPRP